LSGVAGAPKLRELIHNLLIIIRSDGRAIGTLAAFVVSDDGCQTEYQALGQFTLALQVDFHAGKVTGFVFGETVEHDACHLMIDKWVLESLEHVRGKLLQLIHRQVKSLHQFVKLHFVNVLAQYRMLAGITHNIHATEIGNGRENGVRTIEKSDLTGMVRLFVVGDQHVKAGLVSREFCLHLVHGHVLCFLDHPKMETFCLHHEVVLVAHLLLNLLDILTWESRNDAVYERGTYVTVVGKPCLETLIIRSKVFLP